MSNGRVGELTVDELRALIRQTVRETLTELLAEVDEHGDSEDELALHPNVATELRALLGARPAGRPLDDIARDIGLDN